MVMKLRYFDIMGLGEPIRMLMVYTSTQFEDIRVPSMEEWIKIKMTQPFKQMPVLELDDGRTLTQSTAILNYLAEPHGLIPSDPWQRAKAMEMALQWLDYQSKLQVMGQIQDKAAREAKFYENVKILYEPKMRYLDETLKASKSGFIADTISYADFVTYVMMFAYKLIFKRDPAKEYPTIAAFMKKIEELPKIKEWIQNGQAKIYATFKSPLDMD